MQLLSWASGGSHCTGLLVGLQMALWYEITFETSCVWLDFPSREIRGEAKYRCSIPNSKHEQAVWDSISSVIANCRCVCAMERWLKVCLQTRRGQCIVEKEGNYSYFIRFHQPPTILLLCAFAGGFGVLPDPFFSLRAAPWHLFSFQTVNHDVV